VKLSDETCVLCGSNIAKKARNPLRVKGHNPWPLAEIGRACDPCQEERILPLRYYMALTDQQEYEA
jgi:hypothetical protein